MAMQSPLDVDGTAKAAILDTFEWAFLAVFTLELLCKVVAYSIIWHKEAYLRDPWCQLDFTVVTLAWLPILFPSFGNYSVLRAFRALRPLRALKRMPGMPLLVQWILSVLPKMFNVVLLCTFVFLVFGIVGMELFKGALHYRCAAADLADVGAVLGESDLGGAVARRILRGQHSDVATIASDGASDTDISCNPDHSSCPVGTSCHDFGNNPNHGITSFDSVPSIVITYFQAITFDDWANAMYKLMDAVSPVAWLYFVLIVVVAGLFVTNLFLAVIFLEYDAAKEARSDRGMLTHRSSPSLSPTGRSRSPSRRSSSPAHSQLHSTPRSPTPERGLPSGGMDAAEAPPSEGAAPPAAAGASMALVAGGTPLSDGTIKLAAPAASRAADDSPPAAAAEEGASLAAGCTWHAVATSSWLANSSLLLVLLNVLVMCLPYEGMGAAYAAHLESTASLIAWCFIVEMAIKLIGLGCVGYWADGWNVLDGTLVTLSAAEMILALLITSGGVNVSFLRILRMLRMLRVLRVLRLMRRWRGLYNIVFTFLRAVPQMSNLFVLILLTMFMFSLLGMQLFGGDYSPQAGYSPGACPGGVCSDGLEEKPYYHFDYFVPAMITIFILLTGEWIDALEPAAALRGAGVSAFFMVVVMVGKYLLLNLLIAVLLSEFAEGEDESGGAATVTRRASSTERGRVPSAGRSSRTERGRVPSAGRSSRTERGHAPSARLPSGASTLPAPERQAERRALLPSKGSPGDREGDDDDDAAPWPANYSLCCFGPRHPLRRVCCAAIAHPAFDRVVISAILASSVCLALDSPRLDPHAPLASHLRLLDIAFTWLFLSEMATKVLRAVLIVPSWSYLWT